MSIVVKDLYWVITIMYNIFILNCSITCNYITLIISALVIVSYIITVTIVIIIIIIITIIIIMIFIIIIIMHLISFWNKSKAYRYFNPIICYVITNRWIKFYEHTHDTPGHWRRGPIIGQEWHDCCDDKDKRNVNEFRKQIFRGCLQSCSYK